MYQKERFRNNYDFLRVFAALCIMFSHSFGLLNNYENEPLRVMTGGRFNFSFIGLCIFFSISGFLIAKSAERSSSLIHYLWKRFLRIQPLLFVVCFVSVLVIGPFFTSLSPGDYFLNVNSWTYFRNILPVFGAQFTLPGVFVNNIADHGVNGSLWTLIVEERLYLIIGVFILLRKSRFIFLVFLILPVNILYLANRLFFSSSLIPYLESSPFFYALLFLNSAGLYFLRINLSKNHEWYLLISAGLIFIGAYYPVLDFIYFFAIPVFINSLATIRGVLNKTGKFGDFTYGIYVFAFPVQQMLIALGIVWEPYHLFFYTSALVVPLAVISWHLLEKRALSLKNLVK